MKKLEERKLNNNGFSLVELIIVIAIMAVLVGVLSPQFIKYVEQSRRATDIQNAQSIQTAILADIADGAIKESKTKVEFVGFTTDTNGKFTLDSNGNYQGIGATTITTVPTVQGNLTISGNALKGKNFYVTYDVSKGTCSVYPDKDGTYDLTVSEDIADGSVKGASSYKVAEDTAASGG
jgi:type IV pilus assembly protein PilA